MVQLASTYQHMGSSVSSVIPSGHACLGNFMRTSFLLSDVSSWTTSHTSTLNARDSHLNAQDSNVKSSSMSPTTRRQLPSFSPKYLLILSTSASTILP